MKNKYFKFDGWRKDSFSDDDNLRVFQVKTFERLLNDTVQNSVDYNYLVETCENVWMKFSHIHQKSPSHKNNNVQNCQAQGTRHRIVNRICDGEDSNIATTIRNDGYLTRTCKYLWSSTLGLVKFWFCCIFLLSSIYCIIVLHKPTQAMVSRNTQDVIYPIMRFVRLWSLPYVKKYPGYTKLYEDSCLVPNPYFSIYDLDCWPCETVRNIIDLTGFSNFSSVYHDSGIPFIVKDAISRDVGAEDIRAIAYEDTEFLSQLYASSAIHNFTIFKSGFDKDPGSVLTKNTLHVSWKINRALNVRKLRKYFKKPYFVPNTAEVSVQHFLFVDQTMSPLYALPLTEFANVFLTQASGSRYIILFPTEWCKNKCKILSVVLQPKDVLFYNWLYWRPKSKPVESFSSNLSITYIGSFY